MVPTRLGHALIASALAIVLAAPVPAFAAPAPREDYPSWDEVLAARNDAAATEATVATLAGLLDGLQAEAARLGDAAVARAAEADAARTALQTATAAAERLTRQSKAARDRATTSTIQAAQVAAALYRTGGADLASSMFIAGDADDLLPRLGTLDRVGSRLDDTLDRAQQDANAAASLADQAGVARGERDRLATEAESALIAARAAEDAANAAVAAQQAQLDVLYAQLATLRNTTAELEQQYRIGLQANNDPGAGGGGGGSTDPGSGFVVPGNEVNNVAAARAYAWALLAASGFGAEQNDCLLWLWNRESGWRTNAYNVSSGAYGIPQSLPGSKMALAGADWRTNYETQVRWGISYISGRYGTPCGAWAHSERVGWY